MNKLNNQNFEEIKLWIYRNARPLELSIWQNTFEHGSKESIISALAFYQNKDGGFGHAMEADCWNPNSTPYTTLNAINILKNIDFHDVNHPMVAGIFKFLESGAHCTENGWLFSIPSNNDYPHAPWWTYDSKANEVESIGVTAELVSYIIHFADSNSNLYHKAVDLSKHMIEKLRTQRDFGDMGIDGYCTLVETLKHMSLVSQYDYDILLNILKELVYTSIERDTAKWVNYGVRPSNYIESSSSVFYEDNKDIVEKELEYLIDTRPKNGVWDITWSWFENNDKYAKEFAISENWWRASKAIEKMVFLRSFNRFD